MREQIVQFLRRELVGPDPIPPNVQPDGEEILIGDPPRLRYATGVLFPQHTVADTSSDVAEEEGAGPDEAVGAAQEETPDPEVESGSGGGSVEARDNIADETISLTNAFLPSALGLSCLVDLRIDAVVVDVTGAWYRKEARTYETSSGEVKQGVQFARMPLELPVRIPLSELLGAEARVLRRLVAGGGAEGSGLELGIVSRPCRAPSSDGRLRLLTVTLVNTLTSQTGRPGSEECFFQAVLRVRAADGSACFLEYPMSEGAALDPEEEGMALLYRHRRTFAIGHGCAVEWSGERGSRVDCVRTEVLPLYEVKPIVPTKLEGVALRMLDMSDLGDEEGIPEVLSDLCARYGTWIDTQRARVESPGFPEQHRAAAARHLKRCRMCLARMRAGIELLCEAPLVMRAFRLANRAMLLQQLRSSLPLRKWRQSGDGSLEIEPLDPALVDTSEPPERNGVKKGSWYPFQIAFILLNLRAIADSGHPDRRIVDLIWFPTGGGKTEAYLGLSAFAILLRRLRDPQEAGTTVLMRYTLRLLTTQQYQRAASLACALEQLRCEADGELGGTPITIGLWVGESLTRNTRQRALTALRELAGGRSRENPFIILKCPWCGAEMGQFTHGNRVRVIGYERQRNPATVVFRCRDQDCEFSRTPLPLMVIDEDIYESPPTLLIGTVDKFALIPWRPESRALFGLAGEQPQRPPELIIQDELHLISGPLGSMVGHYETAVQELCSRRHGGQVLRPKIVASTATISRAAEQCAALYACRREDVFQFPPQCLRAGDSFFAYEDEAAPGRLYMGVHASALPSQVTAQVRVLSALLQAPLSAGATDEAERNPYWTVIWYFNSLRELGHAATLIRADITQHLNAMRIRKRILKPAPGERERRRFINLSLELTSRVPSSGIPDALQRLERDYPNSGDGTPVDVCLATNMISVGVDVPRLGVMAVTGQPKTTSEYIQATSRVGRRDPGLVTVIYNTGKPRDRSHYEHFRSYHASIYRYVEPTSVTPFATPVRERALHAVLVALVRALGPEANRTRPQPMPDEGLLRSVRRIIEERVAEVDEAEHDLTLAFLDELLEHWRRVLPPRYGGFGRPRSDIPLMHVAGSEPLPEWEGKSWPTPTSLRNVDATCEAAVVAQYPQPDAGGDE